MASPAGPLAGAHVPRAAWPASVRSCGSVPLQQPALDGGVWRALCDDSRTARALAIQHDPAVPGSATLTVAARRRMTALSSLHAQMLASAGGEGIDLAGCLRVLCDAERLAVPASAGVALYADLRPVRVAAAVAAFVGLAFCELLRNALTHAFPQGGAGHVGIHLWPIGGVPGVRACLLVADDGRGFGDEPSATSGRGIPLARHLVGRCGGTLTREPGGPGTVWRAKLAAADAAIHGFSHPNCYDQ